MSRIRANLAALTTIQNLRAESRLPTASEQQILARWSGWGAISEVFDDSRPEFAWARAQLEHLMTAQERAAAARNTLNAHYTDAALVQAIWTAAAQLGFTGGRVLEPGCGSGNFIAFAPPSAQITGIELDPVTAAIASALYPDSTIIKASFADFRAFDAFFDLTIGNVPFGQITLHDPRHNRSGHSIHNHFIVKALHLTRPGGLVMVLTSRYTMDSRNPAARREIAALADLAGAIRLPSRAHQRAAGTSVVTDLLILRRREPGRPPDPTPWEQTRPAALDGTEIPVNEYFLDHPDAVLGTLTATSGAYRADDLAVTPTGDTVTSFTAALARITASARSRGLNCTAAPFTLSPPPPQPGQPLQHPDGYLQALPDGTFTEVADGQPRPFEVPRTQATELRALLRLRDATTELLQAEAKAKEDLPYIEKLRGGLRQRYDSYVQAHGPLNRFTVRRTGRTDPATGEPATARVAPPQGGFRGDPYSPLVYALEEFDAAEQRATKAAIFTARVIAPRAPRFGADTVADALAICLDTHGEPRLREIARLLGATEAQARRELGTLVFNDPGSGRLVPAAEYLSGNVRHKLRATERDQRYAVNADELAKVVPADLTPDQIDARIGAAWIDAAYVQQFLRETLDDPTLIVEHPGGQIWGIHGKTGTILASSTWGTERYPAPQLAQAICEQRRIEVRDTIRTPAGDRSIPNVDETLAAQAKATELAEHFSTWAWQDPARAADLARTYNQRFNNLVLRSYDNADLTLPGLSLAFRPRRHQVAAVARMISEPAVLLAHEVGAGKTAEMIMGVTELRRLGLIRKPAIVVPNHMLEQFAREWLQLYPQAKVLLAHQFRGDQRRRFIARCATGNWDGIVMSRSAFERIPLSRDEQAAYLERELDQTREWITAAQSGSGLTVKRLQAALLRAEERLKAKLDSAKDPGITFEATGIDYLCVDEAHGYKNLRTPSRITDAAIDGSMRASDLDMKIDYLRRRNGSRVVTFATATPIANSLTVLVTWNHRCVSLCIWPGLRGTFAGKLTGTGVLRVTGVAWAERWPVLGRHERAAEWLGVWADLGRSPRTIDAYARGLAEYLMVCERDGADPLAAGRGQVAAFVRDLAGRPSLRGANVLSIDSGAGLANATLQQRLVAVRLFYEFLVEEGVRESNPVGRGRYTPRGGFGGRRGLVPRVTRLPWIPGERQWLDILDVARREPVRNRVMLALAYDAALRREELCSLQTSDLDPAHRTLRVRAETTKNRRERVVPYSAAAGELLSGYLVRRSGLSRARGPLFLSESRRNYAQPLSLWTWSKVVRQIALEAGVPQFSTHTLRHLCLTDLARMGWEVHAIAAFAGHRCTDSTLTYIHLSGRDLAGKLSSGMEHIHGWRVRMLASAGDQAEVPR